MIALRAMARAPAWRRLAACAVLIGLSGCTTFYPEAMSAGDAGGDSVVLVGRIELVPPLRPGEQDIRLGTIDPFDAKSKFLGRAMLYLSGDAHAVGKKTSNLINPTLGKTFFFVIPKSQRYVTYASVVMLEHVDVDTPRTVSHRTAELLMPPVELALEASDRAVYLGTWRLYRDEFNEVYKQEVVDQYRDALTEFRRRFGADLPLRKALIDTR